MKKSTLILIIIATLLCVIGTALCAIAVACADFDFTKLSTQEYKTVIYEPDFDFSDILIDVDDFDIELKKSLDGKCKVSVSKSVKIKSRAEVENGVLVISTSDDRKWHDKVGFFIENNKITLYLPEKEYETVKLKNSIGDVYITDLECVDVEINVSTGDVDFKNTDARKIYVKASTGDVKGNLLSGKLFDVKTSTGNIKIPESTDGGICKIITSTGDVKITVGRTN